MSREAIKRTVTVEKRWITSVLATIILSTAILILSIDFPLYHGYDILSDAPFQISSRHFAGIILCAAVMLVLSIIAFIDYFSFEVNLRVRRQVAITKKELQEQKARGG
jgi:hypothetical protein